MITEEALVSHLGGVARGTALQRFGCSRHGLARAVGDGRIARIRVGVFAVPHLAEDVWQAAAHGGALTCARALSAHGIWVIAIEDEPHVWLGRGGREHPHASCHCVTHRSAGTLSLGVVDVETALGHLYRCQGAEAFFVALESALRLRAIGRAARARLKKRLPRAARWLIDLARDDADSGLESLLRLRLHLLGISLQCQVSIRGVGRVDFVLDRWLILEADGAQNHDGASMRHKDLSRDAAASRLGYETLRFDYALIVHEWETVQAAILAARARLEERG